MEYETLKSLSAMIGLIIFIALFGLAVAYAFWPGNKERFERARRQPLEKDPDSEAPRRNSNGR
jgi:cytochrome c oxidase cbb3-type subunit 4